MIGFQDNKKGFTLIEILVAIGIVAILATVVLVSLTDYAKKGRSSRALAQVSSAIPSMVSCWGNGGTVSTSGTGNICVGLPGYGTWPSLAAIGYTYVGIPGAKTNSWNFTVSSDSDGVTICCNSAMNSCGEVASAADCTNDAVW